MFVLSYVSSKLFPAVMSCSRRGRLLRTRKMVIDLLDLAASCGVKICWTIDESYCNIVVISVCTFCNY